MAEIKNLSDGLFTKEIDSIYAATESVKDDRLNTGHDYTKDMLTRSISPVLLNNTYLSDFILLIQDYGNKKRSKRNVLSKHNQTGL